MKRFRIFLEEMSAGNVAGGPGLAMYDPLLPPAKIYRRKKVRLVK